MPLLLCCIPFSVCVCIILLTTRGQMSMRSALCCSFITSWVYEADMP